MTPERRKHLGSYYTPAVVASTLVRWAARTASDRLLDPACGDGRFLACHHPSVGIDSDEGAIAQARVNAPWSEILHTDFFQFASATECRFDCAAGNPPFIRYQRFAGAIREHALGLCHSLGVEFSALVSSWAPFLVAAASCLKPGGRMAFVVPAEIGHAPYAAPLVEFLLRRFSDVRIVAIREKVFPDLSEDCWLLFAGGYGGQSSTLRVCPVDRFSSMQSPPLGQPVSIDELASWRYRIRPFLVGRDIRSAYTEVRDTHSADSLGSLARVGIGYVTGDNDFFHLRPSEAKRMGIEQSFLKVAVRNGRMLQAGRVDLATVKDWIARDLPVLLLALRRSDELSESVRRYLDSESGRRARNAFKCRHRNPWYVVPDVQFPHAFLAYMSGTAPALVENVARTTGTNSVHVVQAKSLAALQRIIERWRDPLVALSCELEGHPLGGGMLKLEPREAQRVLIPRNHPASNRSHDLFSAGARELQAWRHVGGAIETAEMQVAVA